MSIKVTVEYNGEKIKVEHDIEQSTMDDLIGAIKNALKYAKAEFKERGDEQ